MKYAFASVLFASVAYAAATTSSAAPADAVITAAPTHSPTTQELCLAKCQAEDNDCRAECGAAPFPHSNQLVDLQSCMSTECIPKQTIAANNYQAYSDCQKSCEAKFYYNAKNTNGVPDVLATGNRGGAAATGTASSGSGSGSGSGSDDGKGGSGESGASGSGTATGTAAKASGSGSAGNKLTFSMGGLVGAIGVAAIVL